MSKLRTAVNDQDHRTGNLHAKVVLVEYGDYQCPHCGIAHPFVKKLLKQFPAELLFVFRNFPLQEVHPYALLAAQAAEAADKQGKFWEMHNLIYEHQDELSSEFLVAFAQALHLDIDSFGKDANSDVVLAKIGDDFESGIRSGVNGTPSFFINGVFLNSYDESYESLADAVRSLIA